MLGLAEVVVGEVVGLALFPLKGWSTCAVSGEEVEIGEEGGDLVGIEFGDAVGRGGADFGGTIEGDLAAAVVVVGGPALGGADGRPEPEVVFAGGGVHGGL